MNSSIHLMKQKRQVHVLKKLSICTGKYVKITTKQDYIEEGDLNFTSIGTYLFTPHNRKDNIIELYPNQIKDVEIIDRPTLL